MGKTGANRQKCISRLLRMNTKSRQSQLRSGADPSQKKPLKPKDKGK